MSVLQAVLKHLRHARTRGGSFALSRVKEVDKRLTHGFRYVYV